MEHWSRRSVIIEDVVAITCDICQQRYDDPVEVQAFVQIDKTASFGSIFSDGTRIKCDLCQHCLQGKLGAYLQLEESLIRA